MKLLLHTCCVPCLIGTLPLVEDFEVTCFWFNPNIHPYTEYKSRLDALELYARDSNINLIVKDNYGLREFTQGVINKLEDKCGVCYNWRLRECAELAGRNNFDAFSTSLLISLYQKHEKIKELGEKNGHEYNIKFFYGDFRPNFRSGQKIARENNIYMQKYCGCIFSEEERYLQLRKK